MKFNYYYYYYRGNFIISNWIFLSLPTCFQGGEKFLKSRATVPLPERDKTGQNKVSRTRGSDNRPIRARDFLERENRHLFHNFSLPPDPTSRLSFLLPSEPFQKFLFVFSLFFRATKNFSDTRNVRKSIIRGQRFFFERSFASRNALNSRDARVTPRVRAILMG